MSPATSAVSRRRREAERLRTLVQDCIDRVAELPDSLDQRSPGPDRWSPLQIVEHVVISEREILGFPVPLSEREDPPRNLLHRLGRVSVDLVLRFRIPVPVPEAAMAPTGRTPLHRLRRIMAEVHDWLEAIIRDEPEEVQARPVFWHPAAGALTLDQVLHMDRLHIAAHRRKLEDRIAELGG